MNIEYHVHWSSHLNRYMEFKVYGHSGKPVMFIPCQSGRFFDFENYKMIDYFAPWIESGQCMVFSVDSIDDEAWAAMGADMNWRIENHERWFRYITEEMVPTIRAMTEGRWDIIPFGCSMGAMHAGNLYFRRPDLFGGCFAISGLYDHMDFFNGQCNELIYNNCPNLYLPNLPADHYYRDMYRDRKALFVCGQGAWEGPLLASTRWLESVCRQGNIPARFEYWGLDVDHDWPWWYKMVQTYLPWFLN